MVDLNGSPSERCIIFYLLFTMKTIKDVKERCSVLARDTSQCFHGTVIHYSFTFTTVKSKKKTIAYTSVANHLISLFSVSNVCVQQLTKRIFTILQRYSSLTKFVANNSALIETFLCEKLTFPVSSDIPHCPSPAKIASTSSCTPSNSIVPSPVKTRQDCGNRSGAKKVNSSLYKTLKLKKSEHYKLKQFTSNVKRSLGVRVKKQKLSRHQQKLSDQKLVIRNLKIKLNHSEKQIIDDYVKQISKLVSQNESFTNTVLELKSTAEEKGVS